MPPSAGRMHQSPRTTNPLQLETGQRSLDIGPVACDITLCVPAVHSVVEHTAQALEALWLQMMTHLQCFSHADDLCETRASDNLQAPQRHDLPSASSQECSSSDRMIHKVRGAVSSDVCQMVGIEQNASTRQQW